MRTIRVGPVDDIPERGRKVIVDEETEIGVFRIDGEFHAWHNLCPHQGGPVCQGRLYYKVIEPVAADGKVRAMAYDEATTHIVCPWHGYEYNVKTGKNHGHPALGLRRVQVQVQNGEVYVIV